MKRPASAALVLLFVLISVSAEAQNGIKPSQFSNYPSSINCPANVLSSLFDKQPGENINLSFSDNFSFDGTVVNNVVKYVNLQSVTIRSPYFNNTVFSISKITNNDNTVLYTGRIINKLFFDGYELRKETNGNYLLIKVETDQVIQDCNQQ